MKSIANIISQVDFQKLAVVVAPYIKKFINDETALGKSGKAAKWGVISLLLVVLCTAIIANSVLVTAAGWGALVVVANILLVFLNNVLDPQVKNF